MLKSKRMWPFVSLILTFGLLTVAGESQAMPNFARKYSADCVMCHTQVPKLNKIGYEFRLAGYRFPGDIGKDEKPFNLGDMFAARFQEQFNYQKHDDVAAGKDTTNNQLEFFEATIYPMTGSWGKYFGSIGELSMAPGDIFEVENAYVRAAFGDSDGWFQMKIGVMHPWEGFGGSDRPLGNIRPLFQKNSNGAQSGSGKLTSGSPFYLWNLDESAIEVGYHISTTGTSLAARISNGLIWEPEAPNFVDPAQGGHLSKGKTDPGHNDKNYQAFVNQFINSSSAVSLYYYHGTMPFANPGEVADILGSTSGIPLVDFDRWAAYGNYQVVPKLNLLAGYAWGKDSVNAAAATALNTAVTTADPAITGFNPAKLGKSKGWFAETDFQAMPKLAFGVRYDNFDPSDATAAGKNAITAYTLSANWSVMEGLQIIGDYQHKTTEKGTLGENKDDQFLVRGIIIF